jgi:hypothetical protein
MTNISRLFLFKYDYLWYFRCIRGTYCDINICQNGGTCIKNRSTEKCYCPKDFKGDDCSQRDVRKMQYLNGWMRVCLM